MQLTEEQTRYAEAYDWFALPPHHAPDGKGWRVSLALVVLGPFDEKEQAWEAYGKLLTTVPKAKVAVSCLEWDDTKTDFERACQAAENAGLKLVPTTAVANPINNHCQAEFHR